MTITAKYTRPPIPKGTVTLTLDEETAQKLLALLGQCTSNIFTPVYNALSQTLPREGRLLLTLGAQPEHQSPDVPCISLGACYGAKFTPIL